MMRFRNSTVIGVRPAGQTEPTSPAQPSPIQEGRDGRVAGVDGMLDQIAEALARQAGNMVRRDVLPVLQADSALQQRVAEGIGRGATHELAGPAWLLAGSAAVMAVAVWRRPGSGVALPFAAGAGAALAVCWLARRR